MYLAISQVHGKSKLKKAFCEPGNIAFCPPIELGVVFALSMSGNLLVERTEANGGNHTYSSRNEIENDFLAGSLHPGDLKAAVSTVMVQILDLLTNGMKIDKDVMVAKKALQQYQKKQGNNKK
jgi:tyrosyl-tRNA synthetase